MNLNEAIEVLRTRPGYDDFIDKIGLMRTLHDAGGRVHYAPVVQTAYSLQHDAALYLVRIADLDATWIGWAHSIIQGGGRYGGLQMASSWVYEADNHGRPIGIPSVYLTDDMTERDWIAIYRALREKQRIWGETPRKPVDEEIESLKAELLALQESGLGYRALSHTEPGRRYLAKIRRENVNGDAAATDIFNLIHPRKQPTTGKHGGRRTKGK